MTEPPRLEKPSDEALAALDLRVAKLLREMGAVPEEERVRLDSGKFSGPFAETVLAEPPL